MLNRSSVIAILLLGASSLLAQDSGSDPQQLLRKIEKALPSKAPEPGKPLNGADIARLAIGQARNAMAQGRRADLELALAQLSACPLPEDLQKECEALLAKLGRERAQEEQETSKKLEAAVTQASEAIHKAEKPSDLDPAIKQLSGLRETRRAFPGNPGENSNRIDSTLQVLKQWQDYLAAVESEEFQDAREKLRSLAGMDAAFLLMPRSEILARMRFDSKPKPQSAAKEAPEAAKETAEPTPTPALPTPEEILRQLKKPEDIEGVLQQLKKLQDPFGGINNNVRQIIEKLTALDQAYNEFKAGLSTRVEVVIPRAFVNEPYQNLTAAVRAQILVMVLPRYLGLPENVQAKPGEGPHQFLDRIALEAAGSGDYLLVAKAREVQNFLREGNESSGPDKTQAGLFITARNQETAGQFSLAVTSYLKALAISSEVVPAKVIGERLAELKAGHPKDYEQGLNTYVNPPAPQVYPPYGPFGPGRYPGRPNAAAAQQPAPPVLNVPAATPASAPSASPVAAPSASPATSIAPVRP